MAVAGEVADFLDRRAYDAEHAARGVDHWQVALLYRAQSLGRGRVAGQYHQRAAEVEEPAHGVEREAVDQVERSRAVGLAGIVAQIDIVVAGQGASDFGEYCQAAVA